MGDKVLAEVCMLLVAYILHLIFSILFQLSQSFLCVCIYIGARDYEGTTLLFTFTPSVGSNSVNVTIFNDTIVEATESFFGNLAGTAGLVIASPDLATVTIQEDPSDSKTYVQLECLSGVCKENEFWDYKTFKMRI